MSKPKKDLAAHALKIAEGDRVLAFIFFHVMNRGCEFGDQKKLPTRGQLERAGGTVYADRGAGRWWRYDINSGYDWYFGWNAKGALCKATYGEHDFVEGQPEYDEASWYHLMMRETEYLKHLTATRPDLLVHHDMKAYDRDNNRRPGKRFYTDAYWHEQPLNIDDWCPIEIWNDEEAVAAWRKNREVRVTEGGA